MATALSSLITIARYNLNEPVASFWSDAELLAWMNLGIKALWRALNDNYQDFFLTNDASNVSMAAATTTLTGVPANVATIRGIEPRVPSNYPGIRFESRNYMHPLFQSARSSSPIDPAQSALIYFWMTGAGAPVAAPTIYVAPTLSSTMLLRLVYVPTLALVASSGNNPIPFESDAALVAWTTAYALAKRKESQTPDAEWISIFATEKANILTAATPRQTQDDEVAEGLFEGMM
jgi:hypothetical protein